MKSYGVRVADIFYAKEAIPNVGTIDVRCHCTFIKADQKWGIVLVQVHKPNTFPGNHLDKYLNKYYHMYINKYKRRKHLVVYLKSHRRRPVQVGGVRRDFDPQAAIPAGWCDRCGREVLHIGRANFVPGS